VHVLAVVDLLNISRTGEAQAISLTVSNHCSTARVLVIQNKDMLIKKKNHFQAEGVIKIEKWKG